MTALAPRTGFNWMQVSWDAPNSVRATRCAYCDEPFGVKDIPLILWRPDGWAAEFCADCVERWWGMRR